MYAFELTRSLINKQDVDGALDEIEVCKYISLEPLINKFKCLTKVVSVHSIFDYLILSL